MVCVKDSVYCYSSLISVWQNLKSDRVYVDSLGVCKITDFGEAKTLDEIKGPMTHRVPWVAPEAFTDGGYDCKVDVWGVGCLIFEMLVGKYPWNDGEDEASYISSLSRWIPLTELLDQGCLALDPRRSSALVFRARVSQAVLRYVSWLMFQRESLIDPGRRRDPADRPTASELRKHAWFVSTS